jgi:hypothetical protein
MDFQRVILFCHVIAMVGLFAAVAIEWVSLRFVRRATSSEQAREWTRLWGLLQPIGIPSVLVILASGIYMATTLAVWEVGWVQVAVPTLVIVAAAGGIVGPRRSRLQAAIAKSAGPLSVDLQIQLRQPLLLASWRLRAALLVGLVFEMVARPQSSGVMLMASFALLGICWGLMAWRGSSAVTSDAAA